MSAYPPSTIFHLLEPEEFRRSPTLASAWAADMLAAGFDGSHIVDVAVLASNEWEILARKIGPALAEAGLADATDQPDLAVRLLGERLEHAGALAWLAEFTPIALRLLHNASGWRRQIGVFIHEVEDLLNMIEDGFEKPPVSYDPPAFNGFVRDLWRRFAETGNVPLGWH